MEFSMSELVNRQTVEEIAAITDESKEGAEESQFENYRTTIISKIAYLIGVKEDLIVGERSPFERETIETISKNEKANIIRHLCMLRQQFLNNYTEISTRRADFISIEAMDDLFSTESVLFLRKNGIEVAQIKNHGNPNPTLNCAYINQYIVERINDVKSLFPEWIKFDYVKKLFIMPNCAAGPKGQALEKKGNDKTIVKNIHACRSIYLDQRKQYPYGTFLVWPYKFRETDGNILYNDNKFLKLLYGANGDIFKATEYVVDAKKETKQGIYDFVNEARNIAVFVDCENVDPYMFASTLLNLDSQNLSKIKKIILVDDVHTSPAWDYIHSVSNIPIEHKETQRILQGKSLVDIVMAASIVEEFYKEQTESMILVSSDSDFWGVVASLPNAKFFILNEKRITSQTTIENLDSHLINHCYMDDFAMDKVQEFKQTLLYKLLRGKIGKFNREGVWEGSLAVKEIVDELFKSAQIMGAKEQIEQEKEAFKKKYFKKGFQIVPKEIDGEVVLQMEICA